MVVRNGKIASCTDLELYSYWLDREWYEIMDYRDYRRRCCEQGTVVTDLTED